MNIWYFNHYGGGPGFGRYMRSFHLADEWQKLGHQVTVFVARYHHLLQDPLAPEFVTGGVTFVSLPARRYQGNGIGRILNIADFCWAMLWLRRADRPDTIIVSSAPPFGIFPAAWMARRYGAKLVFEVRDLWPLSIVEVNGSSRFHPFILLAGAAERFAYRYSSLVVSLLGAAEPHMAARGLRYGRFHHAPNGINGTASALVEPSSDDARAAGKVIHNWHAEGRLVLIHPGAQGRPNALDKLISALDLLDESYQQRLGVLLVGEGSETEELQRQAHHLTNVVFVPSVPKADAIWLTRASDIGYAGARDNRPVYQFGISFNKIADFMQAGIPVILPLYAQGDVVSASGCGIVTGSDKAADIGERGRIYADRKLSYAKIAANYANAMSDPPK